MSHVLIYITHLVRLRKKTYMLCTMGTSQPVGVAPHVMSTYAPPTLRQACIEQAPNIRSRRYNPN
jgi:hypothetical protein